MKLSNYIAFLCGAFLLAAAGCSEVSEKPTKSEIVSNDAIPHAQLGDNVMPTAYRLDMVINPDDAAFKGVVEIDVEIEKPTDKIWLHGKHMTVSGGEALFDDGTSEPLAFTEIDASKAPSGVAFLRSDKPLPAGKATLRLPYTTPFNMALNSAYKVERGGEAYIVTQFEAIGAREAFPSFDEPRFKVPFTLSISAPNEDFVYANTPIEKSEDIGGDWTKHHFATTRPLPTYLIAFGVGPYDVVEYDPLPPTDVRKRQVPLRGITAKGSGDRIKYGLKNTAGILEALEDYFGIPYPYEKIDLIAAPDYAFGAMENPGAIVYREYLMLMGENSALSQKRAYARVHSHELAHQWFGNLVTPYWWEDIWLNEAFATWMGNKGTHIWDPKGNFDRLTLNASLGAMNIDTLSTTRKVREPLERTEQVMDQFDGITYRKGGGVLDMFESYLGESKFQAGVRLHMARYADGVATADDFFQSIADGAKDDKVVSAMKSFVDQPGLPLVAAENACKDKSEPYKISLSQSRYAPIGSQTKTFVDPDSGDGSGWQIPVCMKYSANGETRKQCELLTATRQVYTLKTETCEVDWMMLNENGSGYYRFSLSADGWTSLLRNIDHLNTREVLSLQDSLQAAYRAGKVDSAVYLKGIQAFAAHPEYDVAAKAGDLLGWMYDDLPQESRADQARLIRDMYADRYQRVVGTNTVDGNLLAPTLARDLMYGAGDADLLAEYAAQGAAYLGLDSAPDKKATAPNMLGNALRAVMKTRADAAYEPLMDLVRNGSSFEKGAAIGGLTWSDDPAMISKMRAATLSDTDTFTGRQATTLIGTLLSHKEHREATWEWFKENFDRYVTTRVPDVRIGGVPGYGKNFCSLEKRDEVKAFFESKADLIPGSDRSLKQTIERIELCAALTKAKSGEMTAALKVR